jgi:hypothetical protein
VTQIFGIFEKSQPVDWHPATSMEFTLSFTLNGTEMLYLRSYGGALPIPRIGEDVKNCSELLGKVRNIEHDIFYHVDRIVFATTVYLVEDE